MLAYSYKLALGGQEKMILSFIVQSGLYLKKKSV